MNNKVAILLRFAVFLVVFILHNSGSCQSVKYIKIQVYSLPDSIALKGVRVISHNTSGEKHENKTNESGIASLKIRCDLKYMIVCKKEDYFSESRELETPCESENTNINFFLKSNIVNH